jgi:hypothetical protein
LAGPLHGWRDEGDSIGALGREVGMTVHRVVIDHVLFVVSDWVASRRLYAAALAPLGYEELRVQEDGVHYGAAAGQ